MSFFCPDESLYSTLIGRTLAELREIELIDSETTTAEAFRKYVRRYIVERREILTMELPLVLKDDDE